MAVRWLAGPGMPRQLTERPGRSRGYPDVVNMKIGDRITVDLTDLSYLADGVGHIETNLAVFVPAGLPGERVVLEIEEQRQKYVRGRVTELLVSSPDRVVA